MTNFSKLVLKMTEYEGGCVERVNHFLKVFAFAKTIAEGEDVDDATKEILEAAAITHDIGIRVCFEKYGNWPSPGGGRPAHRTRNAARVRLYP